MTRGLARSGELDRRHQELRLRVQQRHAAVAALDDDADGLPAAVDQLVQATDELLAFTDRLPVLRDLPARTVSAQVVRAGAAAAGLGGLLLGLWIWLDVLGWGWLPAVVMLGTGAWWMATLPVSPAGGQHRRQRYLAAACGAAGLLVGPSAVVRGWLPALAVLLAYVGLLFGLRRWGREPE